MKFGRRQGVPENDLYDPRGSHGNLFFYIRDVLTAPRMSRDIAGGPRTRFVEVVESKNVRFHLHCVDAKDLARFVLTL